MTSPNRELVAVPDAQATMHGETARYRLGVRPTSPEASFTIGETGPNGQTFPWIYLRGDGATYEIDLLDGELTVTSRPDDGDVQAVVYKIDIESMTGQEVREGQPVRIVFAYDTLSADDTTEVNSWVATTGPRYVEELRARLGTTDSVVIEMQSDISAAMEAERFGHASRAPRTAEPLHATRDLGPYGVDPESLVDHATVASPVGMVNLTPPTKAQTPSVEETAVEAEEDQVDLSAVQIEDPITGMIYTGRRWGRGQKTTLRTLKSESFRVAILTLVNGESATVVLQHPEGVPAMQLTTRHGVVRQFLTEQSWDQPLKPGAPITVNVAGPMDGDRPIPRGFIPLAPIAEVTATGPQTTKDPKVPTSGALKRFRERERELSNGPGLSRNLVA